ncbi:glycosyltransferase family 87 protein [Sulfobacillus harzensis]|uniref:DUF2029 domain-containing protein n=1 Tax=Sulfobacillus harzensis TaxID=2729629 RepID=A0A7Y0Q2S2_9FIRM|nr:glycosyltransferase family 87 protein [Sulfobacillus harzensis]NMP22655.1 DUF2029 domain-containing protein [Sulfobacillus harzensis]
MRWKAVVSRTPFFWMALAWLWLDIPSFCWWMGKASIAQLLRSPMGFISPDRHVDHLWAAGWYFVGVSVLILSYQPAIQAWETARRKPWLPAGLSLLLASLSFPFVSHDIFSYYGEWRLMVLYHQNPMTTPVAAIPHWRADLWLIRAGWQKSINPYGPAWFALVDGLGRLAPYGFVGFFVFLKAMALASTLVTGGVLQRLRTSSAVRYVLHPVVMVEFLANGHNDVIMVVMAALSFALWSQRRWIFAGMAAGLSVATKYVTLVGLLWLAVAPRDWGQRFKVAGAALVVGVILLAPFWHGQATLAGISDPTHLFLRSPAFIIQGMLVHLGGLTRASSRHWATGITSWIFCVLYLWAAKRFWRTQDPIYIADVLLAAALILMSWLQFWYLGWALPFYVVSRKLRAAAMVKYLAYLEIVRVTGWPFGLPVALQLVQVLLIWGPLIWGIWRIRRSADKIRPYGLGLLNRRQQ